MVVIQVLLPRVGADARPFEAELSETRREVLERFGGVTAYLRSPALGAWVNDTGGVERDDVVMIEVVAAQLDRAWWRAYRERLQARFHQQEIHVRALPIDIP